MKETPEQETLFGGFDKCGVLSRNVGRGLPRPPFLLRQRRFAKAQGFPW